MKLIYLMQGKVRWLAHSTSLPIRALAEPSILGLFSDRFNVPNNGSTDAAGDPDTVNTNRPRKQLSCQLRQELRAPAKP